MEAQSLRTRSVQFAFLIGPPRFVDRERSSAVHGAICDRLSCDDISFQYSPAELTSSPSSRGFRVQMHRKEGRGGFEVVLEHLGGMQPVKLLLVYAWPPSNEHVKQNFDLTVDAVFSSLGGDWQRAFAEIRLRKQCSTRRKSALQFIQSSLLSVEDDQIAGLGTPLMYASIKLRSHPPFDGSDSLSNPSRELSIEVLREDPSQCYIDFMSQWAQTPMVPGQVDLSSVRQIDRSPSEYIEDADSALADIVKKLVAKNEVL